MNERRDHESHSCSNQASCERFDGERFYGRLSVLLRKVFGVQSYYRVRKYRRALYLLNVRSSNSVET
jgi:hypothetical protein